VNCRLIEEAELKEIEPQATGLKALHVPEAAVVDYKEVCNELARQLQSQGAQIFLGTAVKDIQSEPDSIVFDTEIGPIKAKQGIN
jgi:L-2-hydroxyglutarate oxidase